ncbi:MAG: TIM barrel protein [Clostridia bacterium]
MKLCVAIPCFFEKDNENFIKAIGTVSELGFDAVETYNWKDLNIPQVKKALDDNGVNLLSMCTTKFKMTDPNFRTEWLEGLKETCEAANKLGVKKLITQVGQDTGARRDFQHQAIVETLHQGKSILADAGVTIMLEPLNTYVNHKGYYLWSSIEAFEIIREVNHPNVKIIYDIYHQQIMEGNIIPNVVNNLDCIAHLHSAGHPGRNELQFGENDYKVIFDAIDKTDYDGYCGLEYRPLLDPVESLKLAKKLYG